MHLRNDPSLAASVRGARVLSLQEQQPHALINQVSSHMCCLSDVQANDANGGDGSKGHCGTQHW